MTNKLALVVAVVLGVLSILGVRFYVEKVKAGYNTLAAPIDVPVATRDLKAGDIVQKADIETQQIPHAVIDALGGSHYLATDQDKFEGAKVVVPTIKRGQIFQQYHFRIQRATQGRIQPLGQEWRAYTVMVSPVTGLSGMLRPGDKVDFVATEAFKEVAGNITGHKDFRITSTIVQKVEVLAIDNYTETDTSYADYSTVTLKLHPEDVTRVSFVVDNGWPFHLVKMDDTASPSSNVNPAYADFEFDKVEPEIKRFFLNKQKARINNPEPPPK